MPARPTVDPTDARLLVDLGERLRLARARRRWTASEVAERVGITRPTLHRLERGEPAATLGTLVNVMGVLGIAQDMVLLGRDDWAGKQMLDARLPGRRAAAPPVIRLAELPQLRELAWHLPGKDTKVTPQEAFELYERNWRHIDREALSPKEVKLIGQLTKSVGNGVMLV